MRRAWFVLILLGAAGAAPAAQYWGGWAYDSSLTRGAFLTRGVGARAVAMGEAFTAVADDASAVLWNPGGLGQIKSLSAVAQYDAMGQGMGASYVAAAAPVGSLVGAVSIQTMSYGTIQYRDIYGEKNGSESLLDGAVTQGWAFRNPAWLGGAGWSGAAIEVVQETMDNALVGFNAGSLIPVSSSVMAGWAIQHAGPDVGKYSLPETLRLGTAYHGGLLNATMDLSYGLVDHLMCVGAGGEVRVHPSVALRLGYKWDGQDQGIGGFRGLSAGAGVRLGQWAVDYAYQPFGDLATSHRISVEYRLPMAVPAGPRRKEPSVKVMPVLPGGSEEAPGLAPKPKVAPAEKPGSKAPGPAPVAARLQDGKSKGVPLPSPASDWEITEPQSGGTATPAPAAAKRGEAKPTVMPAPAADWALTGTSSGDAANPASLLPPPEELQNAPTDGGGLLTPGGAGGKTTTRNDESEPSFGAPRRGGGP